MVGIGEMLPAHRYRQVQSRRRFFNFKKSRMEWARGGRSTRCISTISTIPFSYTTKSTKIINRRFVLFAPSGKLST
jgi:hypothetical protein